MKKSTILIFITLALILLFSCETNKKLNQVNIVRPINQLLSGFSSCNGGALLIKSIEPVTQFSENEASMIVNAEFKNRYVTWN